MECSIPPFIHFFLNSHNKNFAHIQFYSNFPSYLHYFLYIPSFDSIFSNQTQHKYAFYWIIIWNFICHYFQGQYKSTLVCPDCKKISIAFDPFMYLSLPLPSTATRTMTVSVFYGDGSGLPMPYSVSVLKNGACKDRSIIFALTEQYILIQLT